MSSALLGLPAVDDTLAAGIQERLAEVEEALRDAVRSDYALITDASRHLTDAGGKRFRPMLVLLAAQFGDPAAPGVIPVAVVVELTHLATLYHDDVMDEAVMRRGQVSANNRWNNTIAILTGDYLFARASDLLADLGPEAVRIQARTFARLVRGQIQETAGPAEDADPLDHYIEVIAGKTGSLIAASAQLGSLLAGASPEIVERLTSACEKIGVAFQLSDDILDISSESEESGKTPGTDLREGIRTLPVLHVMRSAADEDARLRELLGSDLTDDARHAEALALLRAHPAMDRARADLRRWVDEARAELLTLPDVPARAAFLSLCDFVLTRTS
ncbi:polyprenyl synthetase family protein [Actinoallomurus rhizosphaericola]|uniref:polyprenyl synthetase family protein n=1 Tax=Actinoallomurus rhizosphaericola TaxID=2952536 RepID=UPI00209189E0|nr:polyprenyl synthetase family protein [Actinoallomurus rhizosphaericola]MCO5994547.1 polyprenyl synthetase family protein [Actinoallomurus rhizosphaericola]